MKWKNTLEWNEKALFALDKLTGITEGNPRVVGARLDLAHALKLELRSKRSLKIMHTFYIRIYKVHD